MALEYYCIVGGALCLLLETACTGLEMSGLVEPTTKNLVAN
jgi:hypothetical protein